jgi:hypothetical protein
MKYIKALFVAPALAIVLSAATPAVASAAWWNPFSWFKRAPQERPAVPAGIENASATSTEHRSATSTSAMTKDKPVIIRVDAPKPAVTPVNPVKATTSAAIEATVVAPSVMLDPAFSPSSFIYPRTVRSGQTIATVKADAGNDSKALGMWYLDAVTFHVVSDSLRSGDLPVSVMVGGVSVKDSTAVNEKVTVSIAGHVASDAISFILNGQIPNHGDFKVVIDGVTGHIKADASAKAYPFMGMPIEGPRFDI